jgi:hypothetical protein
LARTRLMSWFQRLAAEFRAADQLGIPLEGVREKAEEARAARASRRQVLAGGAAIAAATALAFPKVARAAGGTPRIAIVEAASPA